MQQAIYNANEKQGKGVPGRRDIGSVPIAELTRDEIAEMRLALVVLNQWNERGLLDGSKYTKEHTREVISKALGIREDVA
jgi:hypothetical protein